MNNRLKSQQISATSDKLAGLIARLEKASAQDRQLEIELDKVRWPDQRGRIDLPYYTVSIDAALTLVPEGWRAIIYTEVNGAELYPIKNVRRPTGILARATCAATPAIALCIAALKARSKDGGAK